MKKKNKISKMDLNTFQRWRMIFHAILELVAPVDPQARPDYQGFRV